MVGLQKNSRSINTTPIDLQVKYGTNTINFFSKLYSVHGNLMEKIAVIVKKMKGL